MWYTYTNCTTCGTPIVQPVIPTVQPVVHQLYNLWYQLYNLWYTNCTTCGTNCTTCGTNCTTCGTSIVQAGLSLVNKLLLQNRHKQKILEIGIKLQLNVFVILTQVKGRSWLRQDKEMKLSEWIIVVHSQIKRYKLPGCVCNMPSPPPLPLRQLQTQANQLTTSTQHKPSATTQVLQRDVALK